MRCAGCWPLAVLLLAGAAAGRSTGSTPSEMEEIPLVGRPADLPFSEASGWFTVSRSAEPTTLRADTPLTFTVTVRPAGKVVRPPQRIDLRQVRTFDRAFYIEELPQREAPLEGKAGARSWTFSYRLKPRRDGVTEVPSFPFAFFNPDVRPASKGFQVLYTDPIPLRVTSAETKGAPIRVHPSFYELASGPRVLAQYTPWGLPKPGTVALLVLAPPLLGGAWYLLWRRLWPDAMRQAQRQRSRAARLALQALRGAVRLPVPACADRIAAVVTGYFHQRLGLRAAEPTPAEAAAHLAGGGCPPELVGQAEGFFKECDAARFLPGGAASGAALAESARHLILAVEALP
jgi:hypothetical protein